MPDQATTTVLRRLSPRFFSEGGHGPIGHIALTAMTFFQFLVLAKVITAFHLVNTVFQRLVFVALFGFLVHHILPTRFRLPFFCILSIFGLAVGAGCTKSEWATGMITTGVILGAGILLIGLCHVPVAYPFRIGMIVIVAVLLAVGRMASNAQADNTGVMAEPWLVAAWPILGSMFMFRLIIYLYDLKHRTVPFSPTRAFAYFFMLPNACFPLFPIIDYKTFCRTYESENRYQIYQVGLQWIARGIWHLLVYRVITHHIQPTLTALDVVDLRTLAIFMTTTFLLYLNLSGQFHLVIGLLHLFGFNLPETHHNFLLASSFTDFWRRINIYWKNFILKLFFYPLMFRMKKWNQTRALIVATAISFLATWFLHAYQWFWIRGDLLFTWQETFLWLSLCILVIVNSLKEVRHGRHRHLSRNHPGRAAIATAFKTVGTFVVICTLWTIWTSPNFADATTLLSKATVFSTGDLAWVGGGLMLLGLASIFFPGTKRAWAQGDMARIAFNRRAYAGSAIFTITSISVLYPLTLNATWATWAETPAGFVASLEQPLSPGAQSQRERGYYEDLMKIERHNRVLWGIQNLRPANTEHLYQTAAAVQSGDRLLTRMVPSKHVTFIGKRFTTNRWALRDRDYEKQRSPDSIRIVVIGASYCLGWGIHDEETFENVLELRLNRDLAPATGLLYEILNFSTPGYGPIQKAIVLECQALDFSPDLMLYFATTGEQDWIVDRAARAITNRYPLRYEPIRKLAAKADVHAGLTRERARRRLKPHAATMLRFAYDHIIELCRIRGVRPAWVFIPETMPAMRAPNSVTTSTEQMARDAGFTILNLHDIYDDMEEQNLEIKSGDHHPNAMAHAAIANRLFQILQSDVGDTLLSPKHRDR